MGMLDILKSIMTEAECSEGLEDIADEIERLMQEEGLRQVTLTLAMYIRLNEFKGEEREVMERKMREELRKYLPKMNS